MTAAPAVGVVGAGSWGTAFASVAAGKGGETVVWARRPELAEAISGLHRNPDYLGGIDLPAALQATHDLERVASATVAVVMAVPSHAFRDVFRRVATHLQPGVPVLSLSK